MKEKIKENAEKIKVNKTLPYLVSNVIEILDVDPQVFTFKIVFLFNNIKLKSNFEIWTGNNLSSGGCANF